MPRFTAIGFALLVGLAAVGCTTDPALKQGDLNDPTFVEAEPLIEGSLQSTLGGMDLAWDQAQAPADTMNPLRPFRGDVHSANAAVDTFNYSYDTTGWHVAYASASDSGVTVTILDSVLLLNVSGEPLQDWDSVATDFVHAKIHITLSADGGSSETGTANLDYDYTFAGITSGVVTAGGNHAFGFAATSSDTSGATCNIDMTFAQTALDVTFEAPATELDGVCPTGGTVSAAASLDFACSDSANSFAIAGDWSVNATFNGDGTANVQAISDNTQWDFVADVNCVNYENPLGGQ